MPYHHDPDSVMSQYLGCCADQVDLYHPGAWLDTWDDPIPSMSLGSGRSIRGRHWFSMWEAPSPRRLLYYDEMPRDSPQQDVYEEVADSERIEYWKSITKEETVEERAQKEKRARKKECRQERKARDLECRAQQRRARNQFRKGR